MVNYIDKDKLVAELKRRLETYQEEISKWTIKYMITDIITKEEECKERISFIDTIEVKSVDLDAEIERYIDQHKSEFKGYYDIRRIAKHFFELGIKVQKGK